MDYDPLKGKETLPGPSAILICGFGTDIRGDLEEYGSAMGLEKVKIIFCTGSMLEDTLHNAIAKDYSDSPLMTGDLPPVMVLSGIAMDSVQSFVKNFNNSGIKRPIFATSTEHNLNFTVKELLLHLIEEQREAMKKRKPEA